MNLAETKDSKCLCTEGGAEEGQGRGRGGAGEETQEEWRGQERGDREERKGGERGGDGGDEGSNVRSYIYCTEVPHSTAHLYVYVHTVRTSELSACDCVSL